MSAQLKTKIGKEPAVVLPLAEYERMGDGRRFGNAAVKNLEKENRHGT